MKRALIFALMFFLMFSANINAQDKRLDSLFDATQNAQNDSLKLDAYTQILSIKRFEIPDSIRPIFLQALSLAVQSQNTIAEANFHINFGITYASNSLWDSALLHFNSALNIFEEHQLEKNKNKVLSNIAGVYRNMGYFKLAAAYTYKAAKINEQLQDSNLILGNYNHLASIYYDMHDYENTLKYAEIAQKYINSKTTFDKMAINHILKGAVAKEKQNFIEAHQQYLEAETAIMSVYNANKRMAQYYLVSLYNNISDVYYNEQKYEQSLNFAQKSRQFSDSLGIGAQPENLLNIGGAYSGLNETKRARQFLDSAYSLQLKSGELVLLDMVAKTLANFYEKNGNIAEALKYTKLYKQYSDSLINKENKNAIAEMNILYETEKKVAENLQLKLENELKEAKISRMLQIALLMTLLFVLGLFALIVYTKNRQRKIIIKMQENEKKRHYKRFHEIGNQTITDSRITNPEILQEKLLKLGNDIRAFAKMEYSPEFENINLENQLTDTIIEFNKNTNSKIALLNRLDPDEEKKLGKEIKQSTYRIAQELLYNGTKYANAQLIKIMIYKNKKNIIIQYDDDGKGAIKQHITENNGLSYIKSYVEIFNGHIELETAPEQGFNCTVELSVPRLFWLN